MSTNYVIATWSGVRRNPSTEYLKKHLQRLFELKHSLTQITVVRPAGSDNKDFYDLDAETLSKIVILDRPDNDRSYGQFLYAYKTYGDQFSHYIIAEDDYIPNIDNFDTILLSLLEEKGCDYLCGKYGRFKTSDPLHPQQNQGIVKSSAFKTILENDPDPKFHKNGIEDGQEQSMFAKLFTKNGLTISDYSDRYSIPYFDRYLRYFSEIKSFNTIFVPYQCLFHRAFTYEWDLPDSKPQPDSHFLSEMLFVVKGDGFDVVDEDVVKGSFKVYREQGQLFIELRIEEEYYRLLTLERFIYENRSEHVNMWIEQEDPLFNKLKVRGWENVNHFKTVGKTNFHRIKNFYCR